MAYEPNPLLEELRQFGADLGVPPQALGSEDIASGLYPACVQAFSDEEVLMEYRQPFIGEAAEWFGAIRPQQGRVYERLRYVHEGRMQGSAFMQKVVGIQERVGAMLAYDAANDEGFVPYIAPKAVANGDRVLFGLGLEAEAVLDAPIERVMAVNPGISGTINIIDTLRTAVTERDSPAPVHHTIHRYPFIHAFARSYLVQSFANTLQNGEQLARAVMGSGRFTSRVAHPHQAMREIVQVTESADVIDAVLHAGVPYHYPRREVVEFFQHSRRLLRPGGVVVRHVLLSDPPPGCADVEEVLSAPGTAGFLPDHNKIHVNLQRDSTFMVARK